MERTILHCDLNSFYASVEILLDPTLRGKAVAVCGSQEDRHGIVLAKSERAKEFGVKTGEAIWQAQQKCRDLIIVPPQFDQYMKYSALTRRIYEDYTDLIEPFGIDECWLDVTASRLLFGDGEHIAHIIRERVKREIGLTISVGVSFNKVFAKLGSDMKKPDAVTVIPKDGFREMIGRLPASDMLGVGPATAKFLRDRGVDTINDLARIDNYLIRKLGKCGEQLWRSANGLDCSPVQHMDFISTIKSVGHGTTCVHDLYKDDEVWQVMYGLSQDVSHRLRKYELRAGGVQIAIKDNMFHVSQHQRMLDAPTQSFAEIARAAFLLFRKNYFWHTGVRALTVRAIELRPESEPQQMFLEADMGASEKQEKLERAMENIRSRFGKSSIEMASLFRAPRIAAKEIPNTMPTGIRMTGRAPEITEDLSSVEFAL